MKARSPPVDCVNESQSPRRDPPPPPPPPPRSPQLWAPGGARASRAEGGGRREDGRRWPRKGWAAELAKHPEPLREAPPGVPSRPDTKGGVAAAASLRRSRSPESPRLRRRLLSVSGSPADPCLSRACGAARAAAAAAPQSRTAPARPRPRPAPPLTPRLARGRARPSPRVSRRGARGWEGPSWGGQPRSLSSHTRTFRTWMPCDLCRRVRKGGHNLFV